MRALFEYIQKRKKKKNGETDEWYREVRAGTAVAATETRGGGGEGKGEVTKGVICGGRRCRGHQHRD